MIAGACSGKDADRTDATPTTADAFAHDFEVFREVMAESAPDVAIVGPSVASDARSIELEPSIAGDGIMDRIGPVDVFSYHVYPKVSARCANDDDSVLFHITLAASDYGLLDENGFVPRPNYWAAMLWAELMGPTVPQTADDASAPDDLLVYAHRTPEPGGRCWAVLNWSPTETRTVSIGSDTAELRLLTGIGRLVRSASATLPRHAVASALGDGSGRWSGGVGLAVVMVGGVTEGETAPELGADRGANRTQLGDGDACTPGSAAAQHPRQAVEAEGGSVGVAVDGGQLLAVWIEAFPSGGPGDRRGNGAEHTEADESIGRPVCVLASEQVEEPGTGPEPDREIVEHGMHRIAEDRLAEQRRQ